MIVDLLPPGPDLLFAFLGGVILGAVPSILPFPTEKLDPVLYRENLVQLMEVTRPAGLIAEPELAEELRRGLPPRLGRVAVLERSPGPDIPSNPRRVEGLGRGPEEIVLLQHSSGTTGLQKGVALSHRAVLNQIDVPTSAALRLTRRDVIVSWLPLYHDMGLIAGFLLPLLAGSAGAAVAVRLGRGPRAGCCRP